MDEQTRRYYYQDLAHIQNHPTLVDIVNIVTITGLMDDDQMIAHILDYARRTNDTDIINRWTA